VAPDIDLPNPKSGYVPSVEYYDRVYGENRWKFSNIYSLSIGQGETLVTPLQMANLAAIIANKGYYYMPHIIKSIGETGLPDSIYREKNFVRRNGTGDPRRFGKEGIYAGYTRCRKDKHSGKSAWI
jgi:cell division protein FtsI/penicillin-binding protein 2